MALKTDYKDDVFSGNRKYEMITNQDGSVSFVDQTVYTQNGDIFNAADINDITTAINKLNTVLSVSVPLASWSNSVPYTATITATGITAQSSPVYDLLIPDGTSTANAEKMIESFSYINKLVTAANSITLYCYEDKPTIALTLQLKGI